MGLVIVAVSYEGRLTLNFSICPDVVPDGERLTALLEPCLLDIEKAAATLPAESAPEQSSNNRNPTLVNEALNLAEAMVQKSLRRFRKQERSGGGR